MKFTLISVGAMICLLVFGVLKVGADRSQPKPAWGEPVDGISAGLVAEKAKFASGDLDQIGIVLHLRNDSQKLMKLAGAGSMHGWWWEFHLVGGGAPFAARWDDDTGGQPMPPQDMVLDPGASVRVEGSFRQRSFSKWGFGNSSLVPGKYKVVARHTEWLQGATPPKVGREIISGTVDIEIEPRGNDWDKVANADALTLVSLLGDEDPLLRQTASAFLMEKGKKAAPAVIDGLQTGNFWSRPACATILGALRKEADSKVVSALTKALGDKERSVGIAAANALAGLFEAAEPAVTALIAAARNPESPGLRPAAANALGWIGDARPEVVATLVELLGDPSVEYSSVAYAIAQLGPKAKDAVPALLDDLQNEGSRNHAYTLRALQRMGPAAAPAVPALIRILEDEGEDTNLRYHALSVLAFAAGKDALSALERVRDKHHDSSPDDPTMKAFLVLIDSTISRIRTAESESPGKPDDADNAKP